MNKYFLAIDIGASGGRHILSHLEDGKMVLEIVHRFANGMQEKDGQLTWDMDVLFQEILLGMKKCQMLGKIPVSVGIDTWAVDFVLLDSAGGKLGNVVAYRDSRTEGMDEEVYSVIPEPELYGRTGIQKQPFNTIYQLMALKKKQPELLAQGEKLLLIPDYLHYLLTGVAVTEYTNATTTQLVNPDTKDWDWELIDRLGYPRKIFQPIVTPGTVLGPLSKHIVDMVDFNCNVVLPATHDTASAVMAVASEGDNVLYISSGTWSLMGTELQRANCSEESRLHNMTNEGGYNYRFRYLKNIMGLWMIQSVDREMNMDENYKKICELASKAEIGSLVDCNDNRFLAPQSMVEEIQQACREKGDTVPIGIGEIACVIYNSLAKCYKETAEELEQLTGNRYRCIHIVGGGSNAEYLNQITADVANRQVVTGPTEATAVGNIAAQMIAAGELKDLKEARSCIWNSFAVREYNPAGTQ